MPRRIVITETYGWVRHPHRGNPDEPTSSSSSRTRESRHHRSSSSYRAHEGSKSHHDRVPRPSWPPLESYHSGRTMRSASARSYAHVAATRYDYPSGPSRALDESYPFYHSSTHGRTFRDEDPWDLYQPSHRHTSHRTAYDDQSHTKYYSSHRSTSSREAGNRDEHTTSSAATQPGHVVDDIPLSIQQALIKGKRDVHDLKGVFNVVLLYEWCMTEDGKIPNAPSKFDTAFKLLPVKRDNVGGYQPIESTHSSWGVKSGYYPEYDTYLATILIRVPDTLPEVSGRAMERAYARFALKPRIDKLKEILAIPFVNHPQYRNYAILFKFGSECEKYRLFDDHLREDTVIRMK